MGSIFHQYCPEGIVSKYLYHSPNIIIINQQDIGESSFFAYLKALELFFCGYEGICLTNKSSKKVNLFLAVDALWCSADYCAA